MTVYRCDVCRKEHESAAGIQKVLLRFNLEKLAVADAATTHVEVVMDICIAGKVQRGNDLALDCRAVGLEQMTTKALELALAKAGVAKSAALK